MVMIHVKFLWVMTPCSDVVGTLKLKAA